MALGRRQFLQGVFAGMGSWQLLGAGGIARADPLAQRFALQFAQQAAPSAKRKLALLIGIDRYEAKGDWLPLTGCTTDVQLQRELLVHRLGFHPADILELTDGAATRRGIVAALRESPIAEAKAGDLVVVHFSGHGSRLAGSNALVPIDSEFPASERTTVGDLSLHLWYLLLRALPTDRVLCVMDAGFAYPGSPIVGNYRIRARPANANWQFDETEIALQAELSQRLGIPPGGGGKGAIAPRVVVLPAVTGNGLCVDGQWSGFSSGLFTYALVQQLWQLLPATSLHLAFGHAIATEEQHALPTAQSERQFAANLGGGTGTKGNAKGEENVSLQALAGEEALPLPADGAIATVTADRRMGEAWLGGIPFDPLMTYGLGSTFVATSVLSGTFPYFAGEDREILLQVRSRTGLVAKVESLGDRELQVGLPIRERWRVLPQHPSLTVALDRSLSKIERIDATSAISDLPHMLGVNAAEQYADCLFGGQSASYGLFSPGRAAIVGSFGSVGESVGAAIRRLHPLLNSLLAAKLIRMTANQGSSELAFGVSLASLAPSGGQPIPLARLSTVRAIASAQAPPPALPNRSLAIGDRLVCTIENYGDMPLHIGMFGIDPRGKVTIPSFVTSPYASDSVVAPGASLTIPNPKVPFDWSISAPQGLADIHVVACRVPLAQTMALLEQASRQAAAPAGMVALAAPLAVAQALLSDLHRASLAVNAPSVTGNPLPPPEDSWVLDVRAWATLGFSYYVA